MQNFGATIESQYDASPVLNALIAQLNAALDPAADNTLFYNFIWNVATAQGYGLDVWGRIVGVSRTLHIADTQEYLGFEESGIEAFGFDQAPFFSGSSITSNFQLSDDAFRVLIFAKALSNISDGSTKSINQLLMNLFRGRGNCYVIDNLDMSMEYHFQFMLTPVELAILNQTGVLPKPTGVSATVTQI